MRSDRGRARGVGGAASRRLTGWRFAFFAKSPRTSAKSGTRRFIEFEKSLNALRCARIVYALETR